MTISSNAIIHFTEEKDHLKSILTESFRVSLCKERIVLKKRTFELHAPMVSFCDIPLSKIKNHISKYGPYGIGLTRAWALKNGLNPVLYLEPHSHLAQSYETAFEYMGREEDNGADFAKVQDYFTDVLRYMKNYQGELRRKGKETIPDYRFSDEREWRFVPPPKPEEHMFWTSTSLESEAGRNSAQEQISSIRLQFEPNDIKYIVIRSEAEIAEFIDHLRHAKGEKFSVRDVERLTTRILTVEQIESDF